MKHTLSRSLSLLGIAGVAALAGCGSPGNASSAPAVPQTAPLQHAVVAPDLSPDTCGKTSTQNINAAGGAFVLPPCGGSKGRISYAANNAPSGSTVALITTTTNPGGVPIPSGETPVAYVQATGSSTAGSITYGTTTKKSHIANAKFPRSATFSLYAYAFGSLLPGFPIALGHPSAKGVLTFPSPLNGQTVPTGITIDFELDTP